MERFRLLASIVGELKAQFNWSVLKECMISVDIKEVREIEKPRDRFLAELLCQIAYRTNDNREPLRSRSLG